MFAEELLPLCLLTSHRIGCMEMWMATQKRVNLAAKVLRKTTDLHTMGGLKGARRASFKTPMVWRRNSRDVVL